MTLTATDPQGLSASTSITITVTPPPENFPPQIYSTTLSPSKEKYEEGYAWTTDFSLSVSAGDPEDDTPLSYVWKATAFRPKSTTPYQSDVTIGLAPAFTWTPSTQNPTMFGTYGQLGNDCYDGQTVRISVEVSDNLGNKSTKILPDIKVYRCLFE